ncbi:MAG: hypothetical protein ABW092_15225 [Candidatus Thiodiazotropha sp.]
MVLKLVGALSGVLIPIVLVRLVSVDIVGYYLLTVSTAMFAGMVARLGMKQPVVRMVGEAFHGNGSKDHFGEVLSSAISLVFLGSFLLILLVSVGVGNWVFVAGFSSEVIYNNIGLWLLLAVQIALRVTLAEVYRGIDKASFAMLFDGPLANLLMFVLISFLAIISNTLTFRHILILVNIAVTISIIISILPILKIGSSFRPRISLIKSLFYQGIPVYFTNIAMFVVNNSGLWVCGVMLTIEETAVYGIATRLMLIVSLPFFLLNAVVQGQIVKLNQEEKYEQLSNLLQLSTTVASVSAGLIALVLLLFGDYILSVLFGEQFRAAVPVLLCLAFGQIIVAILGPVPNVLMLIGMQDVVSKVTIVTGFITIVLSVLFSYWFGIIGVAAITALGVVVRNTLLWMLCNKKTVIRTHANFILAFRIFNGRFING